MEQSLKHKANMLRREHILAAALRVFADRGYRKATIRQIATKAGVADGTIYSVFANKAELMIGLIQPLPNRVPRVTGRSASPDAAPALAELFRERWETLTPEVLERLRVVLSEALVDPELRPLVYDRIITPVVEPLRQAFTAGAPVGTLAKRDPAIASRAMVAAVLGLALMHMLGDKELEHAWAGIPEQLGELFALRPGRDR